MKLYCSIGLVVWLRRQRRSYFQQSGLVIFCKFGYLFLAKFHTGIALQAIAWSTSPGCVRSRTSDSLQRSCGTWSAVLCSKGVHSHPYRRQPSSIHFLSSTEIMENGIWTYAASLPVKMYCSRAENLGNSVFLFGKLIIFLFIPLFFLFPRGSHCTG